MHQMRTQSQAKQEDQPKEPGRNAHKSDPNYCKGGTPSPPVCLSPGTVFFFLLISTWLASLLSFFVEIHFCKAERPGPLSLTTGLVARNSGLFTAIARPQSLAQNQSPASSRSRSRPHEIRSTQEWKANRWIRHMFIVSSSPHHILSPSMSAYVVPILQMKTQGPEKLLKTGTCLP